MKLYSFSMVALNARMKTINSQAGIALAKDETEIMTKVLFRVHRTFPAVMGYRDHTYAIFDVPQEMILDYIKMNPDLSRETLIAKMDAMNAALNKIRAILASDLNRDATLREIDSAMNDYEKKEVSSEKV